MKLSKIAAACMLAAAMALPAVSVQAQQVTATSKASIQLEKGAKPAAAKRQLKQQLELGAIRNALTAAFAVKYTPDVEAKLPQLAELLTNSIEVRVDPADGDVVSGSASLSVDAAQLKQYLTNLGIGAGDVAAAAAKILVSIDEFVGVATTMDSTKPVETEFSYSHDKSSFSDRSAKASGAEASAAASSRSTKEAYAASGSDKRSYSSSSSSSFAGSDSQAAAASRSGSFNASGTGGSASASDSAVYNASRSTSVASSSRAAAAGASDTKVAAASSSERASASRSSQSSSFAMAQTDVQRQNDVVNVSVRTRMPEFNNAKPLAAGDRVLASRLSGEFQTNGLRLVAENDLRAEGGRILPVYEITNNGRIDQFVEAIRRKGLEADVWATGQASYTIVGTTGGQTQCNGSLAVQGRFIESNTVFFEDSLRAEARGNGDQDCRANLGIALATSLARVLGPRANQELNARSSRGGVYTLYLYSASTLKRGDRRAFTEALEGIAGLQMSEPALKENYMAVSVQYPGKLKASIDKVLDKMPWDNSAVLDKANKICVGIEGAGACPAEFR